MNIVDFMSYTVSNSILIVTLITTTVVVGWVTLDIIRVNIANWLFDGRKKFVISKKTSKIFNSKWWNNCTLMSGTWRKDYPNRLGLAGVTVQCALFGLIGCLLNLIPYNIYILTVATIVFIVLKLIKHVITQGYKLADHIKDPNAHKGEE